MFSFNPLSNLFGKGKWILAVTFFEATNSGFNITNENNSFSVTVPGHSNSGDGEKLIE